LINAVVDIYSIFNANRIYLKTWRFTHRCSDRCFDSDKKWSKPVHILFIQPQHSGYTNSIYVIYTPLFPGATLFPDCIETTLFTSG